MGTQSLKLIAATVAWLGAWAAAAAIAQQPSADDLNQLEAIEAKLTSDTPVSVDEARAALEEVDRLGLNPAMLDAPARARELRCRIIASAAMGDGASARALVEELDKVQPDAEQTHRAAYLAACVAGDGRLGMTALNGLARQGSEEEKRARAYASRRFKIVGEHVDNVIVQSSDGKEFALAERGGKPLVLFLWNLRNEPSEAEIAAMKQLYADFGSNEHVEFLGVSANSATQTDEAKTFARSKGLSWPHHYEQQSAGAPITHKALKAGSQAAQIVIDGDGIVRAVGQIGEPGLVYAARAAVGEAEGAYSSPQSRGADGKAASREPGEADESGDQARGRDAKPDSGQRKSNMEAANLMKQARLMFRNGNKRKAKELLEKLVAEYPDSREAGEAKSMLAQLEP
jgi:peroxiredoxin